mmetsp:Transcript_96177/g.206367  ORF Transcript_96177/g.206367 Transcript_96177/m.206367 type:complete len:277 (+) Transcript_96177:843-1673(+)
MLHAAIGDLLFHAAHIALQEVAQLGVPHIGGHPLPILCDLEEDAVSRLACVLGFDSDLGRWRRRPGEEMRDHVRPIDGQDRVQRIIPGHLEHQGALRNGDGLLHASCLSDVLLPHRRVVHLSVPFACVAVRHPRDGLEETILPLFGECGRVPVFGPQLLGSDLEEIPNGEALQSAAEGQFPREVLFQLGLCPAIVRENLFPAPLHANLWIAAHHALVHMQRNLEGLRVVAERDFPAGLLAMLPERRQGATVDARVLHDHEVHLIFVNLDRSRLLVV